MDTKQIARHLTRLELSDDDRDNAGSAGQSLSELRHLFYNTPFEQAFSDMIEVCDLIIKESDLQLDG
jgi:hypothetical protein